MCTIRIKLAASLIALISIVLFLAGCGGGGGGGNGGSGSTNSGGSNNGDLSAVAQMDISDAQDLIISRGDIASGSFISAMSYSNQQNTLFKITEQGYVLEVKYYDEEDNEISSQGIQPEAIYNVNSNYIIVVFSASSNQGYLVRKSDGSVWNLSSIGVPGSHVSGINFENYNPVQVDSYNNIYFITMMQNNSILYKLDISDPEHIRATPCTPYSDFVVSYCVNPDGHMVYSTSFVNRIFLSNNRSYNLPNGVFPFWVGLDGDIKYSINTELHSVDIDTSFNMNDSIIPTPEFFGVIASDHYLVKFIDMGISLIIPGIWEVENPSNTPRHITISEINEIKNVAYSNNYYYLAGNNSSQTPLLLRINPQNDQVTTLLPSNGDEYDIYKMTVSLDNNISFCALRMRDSKNVVGQIDSSGKVTIISESGNSEIVELVRIK